MDRPWRSGPERLFRACVLVLLSAFCVRWALDLVLPLLPWLALVVGLGLLLWLLISAYRRSRW